jgi:polyadenylate-binding protein 2
MSNQTNEFDLPIEGETHQGAGSGEGEDVDDSAALDAMKARVAEMEAEAAKLREMQQEANNGMGGGLESSENDQGQQSEMTEEDKEEVDGRSVYVGNVSKSKKMRIYA